MLAIRAIKKPHSFSTGYGHMYNHTYQYHASQLSLHEVSMTPTGTPTVTKCTLQTFIKCLILSFRDKDI